MSGARRDLLVIPAQAGIQFHFLNDTLDSRLRGNDKHALLAAENPELHTLTELSCRAPWLLGRPPQGVRDNPDDSSARRPHLPD